MTQRINKINRKIYISWFYQNRWPILACLIFITILFFSGLIPFWLGLVGFIFLSLTILLANRVDEKYLSPKNKPNAISEINDKKFKLKNEPISKIHGKVYKVVSIDSVITIIPMYHPAAGLYDPKRKDVILKDWLNVRDIIKSIIEENV